MGRPKFDRINYLTYCRVAPSEIQQQRTSETARYATMEKEIATLAREGKIDRAQYRAEELARLDKRFAAYDQLVAYIERLKFNETLVEREATCPVVLREPALGIMVAARLTGFSSLNSLGDIFTAKYGPELAEEAAATVALATNTFTYPAEAPKGRGKAASTFNPELVARDSRPFKLAELLNFTVPDPQVTFLYIRKALEKAEEPADSDLMKFIASQQEQLQAQSVGTSNIPPASTPQQAPPSSLSPTDLVVPTNQIAPAAQLPRQTAPPPGASYVPPSPPRTAPAVVDPHLPVPSSVPAAPDEEDSPRAYHSSFGVTTLRIPDYEPLPDAARAAPASGPAEDSPSDGERHDSDSGPHDPVF